MSAPFTARHPWSGGAPQGSSFFSELSITEWTATGHHGAVVLDAFPYAPPPAGAKVALCAPNAAAQAMSGLDFEGIYEAHFDFVWRNARRLGVPAANVDDAVQEVFLVVHRRLGEFE